MSRRTLVRVGMAAALLLGGLTTIGCSNAHEPADSQTHSATPTTMPTASTDGTGASGASLDGVPQPPSSPSPESLAAKKVCPNCGFANAPDATACAKCGHKLD